MLLKNVCLKKYLFFKKGFYFPTLNNFAHNFGTTFNCTSKTYITENWFFFLNYKSGIVKSLFSYISNTIFWSELLHDREQWCPNVPHLNNRSKLLLLLTYYMNWHFWNRFLPLFFCSNSYTYEKENIPFRFFHAFLVALSSYKAGTSVSYQLALDQQQLLIKLLAQARLLGIIVLAFCVVQITDHQLENQNSWGISCQASPIFGKKFVSLLLRTVIIRN